MNSELKDAFDREMDIGREAYRNRNLDRSFQHFERAHILGQRYFTTHMLTHWWMLKVGVRRVDPREILGQLTRMVAVIPGYVFGWVPKGNTGGANVCALKPMQIPDDLAPYLADYIVARDVLRRVPLLLTVALLGAAAAFAL